jgi:hypothetical protein
VLYRYELLHATEHRAALDFATSCAAPTYDTAKMQLCATVELRCTYCTFS